MMIIAKSVAEQNQTEQNYLGHKPTTLLYGWDYSFISKELFLK